MDSAKTTQRKLDDKFEDLNEEQLRNVNKTLQIAVLYWKSRANHDETFLARVILAGKDPNMKLQGEIVAHMMDLVDEDNSLRDTFQKARDKVAKTAARAEGIAGV